MSRAKFSQEQLKGAYEAGRKAGFKDGIERMRLEGWRRVTNPKDLKVGDYVKALESTISGWRGYGWVEFVAITQGIGSVIIRRADDPERKAEYLHDQLAKKWVEC